MKIGIALGMLNPRVFEEVTIEADRLGYASVWLPEHLVFPTDMSGSPHPGEDTPPVPPSTPVFDCFAMLSFHATTIISARRERAVAVAGDGQVSLGDTIAKADAVKVRLLPNLGTDDLVLLSVGVIRRPIGQALAVGIAGRGELYPVVTDQIGDVLVHLARLVAAAKGMPLNTVTSLSSSTPETEP